jgi:hypothetical protein
VIIKDLTDAETLLATFSRDNKSSVNQSVTQGFISYTYGAQGIIKSIRGYKQDFG